jgi:hypothetical protein
MYMGVSLNGMESSESIVMERLTDEVGTTSALPCSDFEHRLWFYLADCRVEQLSICNPQLPGNLEAAFKKPSESDWDHPAHGSP